MMDKIPKKAELKIILCLGFSLSIVVPVLFTIYALWVEEDKVCFSDGVSPPVDLDSPGGGTLLTDVSSRFQTLLNLMTISFWAKLAAEVSLNLYGELYPGIKRIKSINGIFFLVLFILAHIFRFCATGQSCSLQPSANEHLDFILVSRGQLLKWFLIVSDCLIGLICVIGCC